MSARCYKCAGPTQPAALNPKNLWCTVCAEELNQSGGPLTIAPAAPPAAPFAVARGEPSEEPASTTSIPEEPAPPAPPSKPTTFRVSVGSVSFTVTGRTELSVGKSKVLIEPL